MLLRSELDSTTPRAMLSDFNSSEMRSTFSARVRSGGTGTLDWLPPENLRIDPALVASWLSRADVASTGQLGELSTATDLWSLGLLAHLLCYLRLCAIVKIDHADAARPWSHDDVDPLRAEILAYGGFDALRPAIPRHDLPRVLLELMSDLLSIKASRRPRAAVVLQRLRSREPELDGEAGLAALVPVRSRTDSTATLKALTRATPSPEPSSRPTLDRLAVSLFVVLKAIAAQSTLGSSASHLVLAIGLFEVSMCVSQRCDGPDALRRSDLRVSLAVTLAEVALIRPLVHLLRALSVH